MGRTLAFLLMMILASPAWGAPTIFVEPPERMVALGDSFSLGIRVDAGTDTITCFLVRFQFDAGIVELVDAAEGTLFAECGFPTMYNWDVLGPGEHSCNDVTLGPRTYALCPGELVHLSFNATALGQTPITIMAVDLRDIRRERILPVWTADGLVIVGPQGGVEEDCDGAWAAAGPRAFPNPFGDTTTIELDDRAQGAYGEIAIYDIRGRLVASVETGFSQGGAVRASWDGRDRDGHLVGSGVYFAAPAGSREQVCRLVLLR